MPGNELRIRRALLQVARAAHTVLEKEVPESEGLPAGGLPVLRLLRWHGPKRLQAVALFLEVAVERAQETLEQMCLAGVVRRCGSGRGQNQNPTFELAPAGHHLAARIVQAQRERVKQALDRMPGADHTAVSDILERLASGLIAQSTGLEICCAACWAHDSKTCIRPAIDEHCAFLSDQTSGEGQGDRHRVEHGRSEQPMEIG